MSDERCNKPTFRNHPRQLSGHPVPNVLSYLQGLGAYETPIDKLLSLPPQRATLELMPDQVSAVAAGGSGSAS